MTDFVVDAVVVVAEAAVAAGVVVAAALAVVAASAASSFASKPSAGLPVTDRQELVPALVGSGVVRRLVAAGTSPTARSSLACRAVVSASSIVTGSTEPPTGSYPSGFWR